MGCIFLCLCFAISGDSITFTVRCLFAFSASSYPSRSLRFTAFMAFSSPTLMAFSSVLLPTPILCFLGNDGSEKFAVFLGSEGSRILA
uniref:Uncharacterized protein n=1 Tax=Leersia perrieri TaxID=77586 RepID=A0A0D9WTH6_9ORYZ